jgi:hypothetical protein
MVVRVWESIDDSSVRNRFDPSRNHRIAVRWRLAWVYHLVGSHHASTGRTLLLRTVIAVLEARDFVFAEIDPVCTQATSGRIFRDFTAHARILTPPGV